MIWPTTLRVKAEAKGMDGSTVAPSVAFVEATQELASKGLSALFDCCDEASRATILQELVAGLQSSRAANASRYPSTAQDAHFRVAYAAADIYFGRGSAPPAPDRTAARGDRLRCGAPTAGATE